MNSPRFTVDPNPPVSGGPVTVTYEGDSGAVEWSVDGGPATKHDVPPHQFTIESLPAGDTLFLTDPQAKVGSVKKFPIDEPS